MVPRGYPRAIDDAGQIPPKLERAILSVIVGHNGARNLDWWTRVAIPAVEASWLGVQQSRDPASMTVLFADPARLPELVARHEAAQERAARGIVPITGASRTPCSGMPDRLTTNAHDLAGNPKAATTRGCNSPA